MMDLMRAINGIVKVHNVEKRQINDTTNDVASKGKTCDKDTNLKNNISDKNSNKTPDDKKINNNESNFNKVLTKVKYDNSKADEVNNIKNKIKEIKNDNSSDTIKLDEIQKEIDEKIEELTDDELMQCLNYLAYFFNDLLNNNVELNQNLNFNIQNFESSQFEDLNNTFKTGLMNIINSDNPDTPLLNELFKNVDVTENVDEDILKFAQKLMSQISEKLDNTTKDTNAANNLTELINATENKINELLDKSNAKNNEVTLENNSLNNIYKNISSDSSSESENDSNSQNYQSAQSKDEKVLESILNDKSSNNPVPVFTTNTIVNNAAGTVIEVKQVVNAGTIVSDIIQDVKYMASNDMREMVVKVNPANLGEITIKLVEEDGIMKLHMKASSKETYSLLVQQSSDIKNQLNDQNIKIHDVNISLYDEDTTFFKDGEFSNSFNEQKGNKGNGKTNTAQGKSEENENIEDDKYDSNAVNMLV